MRGKNNEKQTAESFRNRSEEDKWTVKKGEPDYERNV